MRDEGFLSPAGKRFIAAAALILLAGVVAYYAFAEDVSLDFLEDLGEETSTSTTTFDFPEVEIPTPPEPAQPQAPGIPPSAQEQIREGQEILDCIQRANGDVDKISACTSQ